MLATNIVPMMMAMPAGISIFMLRFMSVNVIDHMVVSILLSVAFCTSTWVVGITC
ncbi:hypothetical protein BPY_07550 [Bifidobacterium psychraerophilum]